MYIETTCISMYESMNLCIYLLTCPATVWMYACMHLSEKFSSVQTPSASMNACIYLCMDKSYQRPTNSCRILPDIGASKNSDLDCINILNQSLLWSSTIPGCRDDPGWSPATSNGSRENAVPNLNLWMYASMSLSDFRSPLTGGCWLLGVALNLWMYASMSLCRTEFEFMNVCINVP